MMDNKGMARYSVVYVLLVACAMVFQIRSAHAQSSDSVLVLNVGGDLTRATWSHDGAYVATGGLDTMVRFWDARTGKELKEYDIPVNRSTNVEFFPDGDHILLMESFPNGDSLLKWNWRTRKADWTIPCTYATCSYDGSTIVAAANDHKLWVVDTATGALLRSIGAWGNRFSQIRLSSYGDRLCYVGNGLWNLIDVHSGTIINTSGIDPASYAAHFSWDDKLFTVASPTVHIMDAQTGDSVLQLPDLGRTYDANFSPDGKYIATFAIDYSVRLWNLKDGSPVALLGKHDGMGYSIEFSPDGRHVLTSGTDRTARIWPVPDVSSSVEAVPAPVGAVSIAVTPNPATNTGLIRYNVPRATHVRVSVIDMRGHECLRPVDEVADAGPHTARVDLSNLASGTYLCVEDVGGQRSTQALTVEH